MVAVTPQRLKKGWAGLALALMATLTAGAHTAWVRLPPQASARVQFGAEHLEAALCRGGFMLARPSAEPQDRDGLVIRIVRETGLGREAFSLKGGDREGITILGGDDSGMMFGCLELAKRVRAGGVPSRLEHSDRPALTLRGACVGLQKTTILPGRKVYEYPYTPDLFPWFYEKRLWLEYLDFLVEHRFNALFLWNGHPFASLLRLPDYPQAVEVPPEVFERNVEMYRWLAGECDRRGIWLVQMFYNIFLPQPLAAEHGVPTQLAAPTALAADYTRKSIAEFIKQYPNVGLMVCLGEALQGTSNQLAWATQTLLPGVHDGMRAAGLTAEPPIVIRTHAMDAEAIMPACFQVYSNLFTETKYNGESLTTYEPRGKAQATHLAMARLGPHLVNVHILSNLEPFRYGAARFIKKSVVAARDRLGASGLHLYPLSYWNWPYSPDVAAPPLKQWERDWMWFAAWGRYAWNPDCSEQEDRAFWFDRLTAFYGCDEATAGAILEACNAAGEVAPILVRRFGITEGNRQTLSLGMTLDQLVNPKRYNAISELWESQAPPGERLEEFVQTEWRQEPHVGETPVLAIQDALRFSSNAVAGFEAAAEKVTANREEFERWRRDAKSLALMARFYAAKTAAARHVLRFGLNGDIGEMERAAQAMAESVEHFEQLAKLTEGAYHFANSMQTGHRKIPFPGAINGVGTNYHWTQVLPLYRRELQDFRAELAGLKDPALRERGPVAAWPAAAFKLWSAHAEVYEVKVGARPFADRPYTILELAPQLVGLTGIRFSHEAAKSGRYEPVEFEVGEPVCVLIGYFQESRDIWLQVPNLDVASHADERGGVEVVLANAAVIEQCPKVNVHAFRYGPGRHKLEPMGKGSFVVLGVVPASATVEKQPAGKGVN
jgi:hypothetical protein